ncbi:MAG: choice-of-anchor D domain-containing protein [Nitrospirae bacterium]|nr:choice-of-anchor D domain-containing protein [Nitrospirota bacterium]
METGYESADFKEAGYYAWPVRGGSGLFGDPGLSLSPDSADFGIIDPDTSSPAQTFTILNTGTNNLNVNSINITGGDAGEFTIQNDSCSDMKIGPSAECSVEVVFSPSTGGPKSSSMSIPSNMYGSPITVNLSGTGTQYTISSYAPEGQGVISCSPQPVGHGENVVCRVDANPYYFFSGLYDNGESVFGEVNGNTYSLVGVTADHTIVASFTYDPDPPAIEISGPSVSSTSSGPVTYTVTYADANMTEVSLSSGSVLLSRSGNANGTVSVTGTGSARTITIMNVYGNGDIGITIKAGTAIDKAGNISASAGPSVAFAAGNAGPNAWFDTETSQILHNSNRYGSCLNAPEYTGTSQTLCQMNGGIWTPTNKWGGAWGLPGSLYGPIGCLTCHEKSSPNIKRIVGTVNAPTGSFPGSNVVFNNPTEFGDDSDYHTSSSRICEVCHIVTDHHRYDASGQTDGNSHHNGTDCILCHPHNKGFRGFIPSP